MDDAREFTKEEAILRIMKRVLTDVARETFTKPGHRHPLSDTTIENMRQALGLIAARERELAEEAGRQSAARPRYADELRGNGSTVVDISALKRDRRDDGNG